MRRSTSRTRPFADRPTVAIITLALLTCIATGQPDAAGPLGDSPRGDIRVVVFGDFNGPYGSLTYPPLVAKTMSAITNVWRPDLFLSPGDVVAGQRLSLPDEVLAAMWSSFDREIGAPLRNADIPYAVAMGNHDASSLKDREGAYLFARDRTAAQDYWGGESYPSNLAYLDRSNYPFDYAFVAGELFIAVIDASSATLTEEQRSWLTAVLAAPQAKAAQLRFVMGHLPLVPVSQGRDRPGEYLYQAGDLQELLAAGAVDLYISGHQAAFYPGKLGGLELLFAGGVGARRLLAGDAPPVSTVTIIDIWYRPTNVVYTTLDLATMEVITREQLPPEIVTSGQRLALSDRLRP